MVLFDEAHILKNDKAQVAAGSSVLSRRLPRLFRLCLQGSITTMCGLPACTAPQRTVSANLLPTRLRFGLTGTVCQNDYV